MEEFIISVFINLQGKCKIQQSNVIEKCLSIGTDSQRKAIIDEILSVEDKYTMLNLVILYCLWLRISMETM